MLANARREHCAPFDRNSACTPPSVQNLRVHDSGVERVARDSIRGPPGQLVVEHDVQQLGETVGGVATVPAFLELRHVFESEARWVCCWYESQATSRRTRLRAPKRR